MTKARGAILTAMAAAGLLVAHVLDYALVVPDPQHRHDLLFRTGHGYLARGLAIAAAAALVAILATTAQGLRGSSRRSIRSDAALLVVMQTGAFVTLESIERVLAGAGTDTRFLLVIAVGAILQLVFASVSAWLLVAFERIGRVLAVERRVPAARAAVRTLAPVIGHTVEQVHAASAPPRAPPALAV